MNNKSKTGFSLFWKVFLVIGFIGVIAVNYILYNYHLMVSGDVKIINELGLIRGSSQRIVKSEFYGVHREDRIKFVDGILEDFNSEKFQHGILHIRAEDFKKDILILTSEWEELKKDIEFYRQTGDAIRLYDSSERFFEIADKIVYSSEIRFDNKTNILFRLRITIHAFTIFMFLLLIVNMIGIRKSVETISRLEEISMKDKLTGLNNRRACDYELEKIGQKEKIEKLCFLSIDLDGLKTVNDTYGHAMGDKLLVEFSDALKQEIIPYGFVGRNGGDEFIGIIENCDDDKIKEIVASLDRNIEKRNERLKKDNNIEVAYSFGYLVFSSDSEHTIYEALNLADRRMYENKIAKKYKNTCEISCQK